MDQSKASGINVYEQVARKSQVEGVWKFLSNTVSYSPDDVIIDVGCGTGSFTKLVADRAGIKSITGKTFYHVADAEDQSAMKPEWKEAFSKAMCIAVFRFIRNKKAFLTNISYCVKPGGSLLLRFQHRNVDGTMTKLFYRMNEHPKWKDELKGYKFSDELYYKGSQDDVKKLLSECGFSNAKVIERDMKFYANLDDVGHKSYIGVQTPHLKHIPEDRKEEFIEDAFNVFKEIAPRNPEGKLEWLGPTMIVTATK
ncbi:uncharacterized protein LOC144448683 [Glandiceps talaboti]